MTVGAGPFSPMTQQILDAVCSASTFQLAPGAVKQGVP